MAISGKEVLEILTDLGFENDGLRGNHFVVKKGAHAVLIPDEDELAEKTVLGIIDQAGLGSKDVLKLLKMRKSDSVPSLDAEPAPVQGAGFFSRAWKARSWSAPLALFRVLLGILLIISALEKAPWLPGPFGWLPSFLNAVSQNASPMIKPMVDYVLIPNIIPFGWVQFIIEMISGILLVIGLFTVLTAFVATLWAIFFSVLAVSLPDPFVMLWALLYCSSLALMWTMRAGRCFGVDQAIARAANARKEESGFWKFVNVVIV